MPDYKINLEVALIGGALAALKLITAELEKIKLTQGEVNTGFGNWANQISLATSALLGAGGLLVAMNAIAKKADELGNKFATLGMQGRNADEIKRIYEESVKLSGQFKNYTPSQIMGEFSSLGYATGMPDEVFKIMPEILRRQTIMKAIRPDIDEVEQGSAMIRAMEQVGLLRSGRESEATRVMDQLTKDFIASGGRVTPQSLLGAFTFSRVSKLGFTSDEALNQEHPFVYSYLPHLIQEYSASNASRGGGVRGVGPMLMQSFAKLSAGGLSKKARANMAALGLLDENENVKGAHLAGTNPYEWVQQVLVPALKQKGITDQTDIARAIYPAVGIQNAADMIANMATQGRGMLGDASPYEKDLRLQNKALDMGPAFQKAQEAPAVAIGNLSAQFERFGEVLGHVFTKERVDMLNGLANVFSKMGDWAAKPENADAIKRGGDAIIAVATGLAVLGTGAAITAIVGFLGPGGTLITAIGLMGTLIPGVREKIESFINWAKNINLEAIQNKAKELGQTIVDAVTSAVQAGIDAVKNLMATIHDKIFGKDPTAGWSDQDKKALDELRKSQLPIIPQSFEGPPSGSMLNNAQFNGGSTGSTTLRVSNVINLDGSAIARAVHDYALNEAEHPTHSGHGDGYSSFPAADSQFTST